MNGCQNGNGTCETNGCCEANGNSKDYCATGKVFHTAGQIYVHTGNLTNWSRSSSKMVKSTTDEISESVITTINSSAPAEDFKFSQPRLQPFVRAYRSKFGKRVYSSNIIYPCEQACVRFANKPLVEKIKHEERDKLKVSVKIFLNDQNEQNIQEAVFRDMVELGVDFIDVVILSLPPSVDAEKNFNTVILLWQELEKLVEQSYVRGLAVCDFNKNALEQLCKTAKIKPIIDQINLASCCVMPKDLVEYAENEGIQLLTHADPKDILPSEKLFETINKAYEFPNKVKGWHYSWVTCYSAIIKCRTIIQNKGYIVNLVRD